MYRYEKNLALLAAGASIVVSCSAPQPQQQHNYDVTASSPAQNDFLFLHLLAPPAFTNRAYRILTARVYPFEDFAIPTGEPENPFTNHWDGAWTKPRWNKDGNPEPRPPQALWNSGDAVLAGRIERRSGGFVARLQGRSNTGLSYYNGEIEPEKPVSEQGGSYRSNIIWSVWFVLSASPDCGRFLEGLNNGTIRDPAVVPADSSLAERWKQMTPPTIPAPPAVQPGAAPNPSAPHP